MPCLACRCCLPCLVCPSSVPVHSHSAFRACLAPAKNSPRPIIPLPLLALRPCPLLQRGPFSACPVLLASLRRRRPSAALSARSSPVRNEFWRAGIGRRLLALQNWTSFSALPACQDAYLSWPFFWGPVARQASPSAPSFFGFSWQFILCGEPLLSLGAGASGPFFPGFYYFCSFTFLLLVIP